MNRYWLFERRVPFLGTRLAYSLSDHELFEEEGDGWLHNLSVVLCLGLCFEVQPGKTGGGGGGGDSWANLSRALVGHNI
jgi:hypothetical protein